MANLLIQMCGLIFFSNEKILLKNDTKQDLRGQVGFVTIIIINKKKKKKIL